MAKTINIVCIALLAVLITQVMHEATHGIAALLVGKEWLLFNLFAVKTQWPEAGSTFGDIVVESSAAIVNIITGIVAVALFYASYIRNVTHLRLFVFFLAAYSLLMGFGYLFSNALFYSPEMPPFDWVKVISALGGTWLARGSVLLVGTVGTLATFMWIAYASLRFVPVTSAKSSRVQTLLPLLIIPYFAINLIFSILAFWHPLGMIGLIITIIQFWCGYIGLFWGFFIAVYWLTIRHDIPHPTVLLDRLQLGWVIGSLLLTIITVAVLLPSLPM